MYTCDDLNMQGGSTKRQKVAMETDSPATLAMRRKARGFAAITSNEKSMVGWVKANHRYMTWGRLAPAFNTEQARLHHQSPPQNPKAPVPKDKSPHALQQWYLDAKRSMDEEEAVPSDGEAASSAPPARPSMNALHLGITDMCRDTEPDGLAVAGLLVGHERQVDELHRRLFNPHQKTGGEYVPGVSVLEWPAKAYDQLRKLAEKKAFPPMAAADIAASEADLDAHPVKRARFTVLSTAMTRKSRNQKGYKGFDPTKKENKAKFMGLLKKPKEERWSKSFGGLVGCTNKQTNSAGACTVCRTSARVAGPPVLSLQVRFFFY